MNIAYLFHGHARTWELCYENFFKNVYSVIPGDIFIHTWDRINAFSGSHWNGWQENLKDTDISNNVINLKGILETYKPTNILIEKDKGINSFKEKLPYVSNSHLGAKNMLSSCLTVFNMAKQYKKYDKFFSTRMDINYLTKFEKNELLSEELLIGKTNYDEKYPYIFDIWSVGSEKQFETKTNYINHIDNYWYNYGIDLHLHVYEAALKKYYDDTGIIVKRSNIEYCAPRITGEITYW